MDNPISDTSNYFGYKVRRAAVPALYLKVLGTFDSLFKFFSLRNSKKFWGIIYDSVTKQPLDPVIVKLLYLNGDEIETCITDMEGRYGFLARPGKFKIFARKTNYSFPSKYVSGNSDGIYQNLYHGEFFVLSDESEVVGPNIPMDPEGSDWNQKAKINMGQSHPYVRLLFKKLLAIFFWVLFILSLLSLWFGSPKFSLSSCIVTGLFIIFLLLSKMLPEPRLWGKIIIKNQSSNIGQLVLELHNKQLGHISFGVAKIHDDGKFLLRSNKGDYILEISNIGENKEKVVIGTMPVKIGRAGVFNETVVIIKK